MRVIIKPKIFWPTADRQIMSIRSLTAVIATIIFVGVIPTWIGCIELENHAVPHESAAYATVVNLNFLMLIFPIVATLPYAFNFSGLVVNRFFVYARMRAAVKDIIVAHLRAAFVVPLVTFFGIGLLPRLWLYVTRYTLSPEGYGLDTPEKIAQAERTAVSFSQLSPWGEWAMPLLFSAQLGFYAGLYSVITVCLLLLQRSKVLAFGLPLLLWFISSYVLAVAGKPELSPLVVVPFFLKQMPLLTLAIPCAAVTLITLGLAVYTVSKSSQLESML